MENTPSGSLPMHQTNQKKHRRLHRNTVCIGVLFTSAVLILFLFLSFTEKTVFHHTTVSSVNRPPVSAAVHTASTRRVADSLTINALSTQPVSADMNVQYTFYDTVSGPEWETMKTDFASFTGIEYDSFLQALPEWFCSDFRFYAISTPGETETNQPVLHDYVFSWQNTDGASASITLCPFEAPLRDWLPADAAPIQSRLDGVPITIYGDDTFYLAMFSTQGIYYELSTNGLDLDTLESLLHGLLSL